MAIKRAIIVAGLLAALAMLAFACASDSGSTIPLTITGGPYPTATAAAPDPPEGFRAIHFVDDQNGWVGGYSEADGGGVILATADGGATWLPQYVAEGASLAVDMTDALNGTAALTEYSGRAPSGSTFLQTTDGGQTWTPAPEGTEFENPCRDADGNGWRIEQDGVVLRSDDGGETWNESFTPPDELRELNGTSMACYDDDVVWIVLKGDVASSNMTHAVYRTLDGGEMWRPALQHQVEELGVPNSGPVPGPLRVVDESVAFFFSHCSPCAPYQDRIFRTTDGGATWDEPVPIPNLSSVADAEFLDADRGWIVGRWYDGEDFSNREHYAVILATTDGGKTWTQQHPRVAQ